MEFMRKPVHRYGRESRVTQDDLALGICRRISVKDRLDICIQKLSHPREPPDELYRDPLRFLPDIVRRFLMKCICVSKRNLDLFRKVDQNIIRNRTDRSVHIEHTLRHVRITVIARIYNLEQLPDDSGDGISVRLAVGSDSVDRPSSLVVPQKLLDNLPRFIFKIKSLAASVHLLLFLSVVSS